MRVKQLVLLALLAGGLCACAATMERYRHSRPLGLGPLAELTLALQNNPSAKGMALAAQSRTNALLNNGSAWVSVDFSFSLYGNPGPGSEPGPEETRAGMEPGVTPDGNALVTRHFHMVQGFFSPGDMTRFSVANRNEATDLRLETLRRNNAWCVERVSFVRGDNDWFSQLWLDQGRQVPEIWLAKRYTFTSTTRLDRFVYEYREPYPECLPIAGDASRLRPGMLSDKAQHCLAAFIARADAFVELEPVEAASSSGASAQAAPPVPSQPVAPFSPFSSVTPVAPVAPVTEVQKIASDLVPGGGSTEAAGIAGPAGRGRPPLDPVSILGDVERIDRDDFFRR